MLNERRELVVGNPVLEQVVQAMLAAREALRIETKKDAPSIPPLQDLVLAAKT